MERSDAMTKPLQPLTDAQRDIVAANMPRIVAQANVIAQSRGVDRDIALSGVSMAYIDAIKRYNATQGVSLSAFAERRSYGQVADDARTHYRWTKTSRANQPRVSQMAAATNDRGDVVEIERECYDAPTVDDDDAFMAMIAPLDERMRTVMTLYYREGMTMAEVGKAVGLHESRVSQLHGMALKILRATQEAA
jgi:RNA polymerase sigma factor (sigma-70 family)